MIHRHPHRGEPHWLHTWAEGRALLELAALPLAWPALRRAPRGDGHPVLLLPGFLANDATLLVLKLYLRSRGHDVHTWGQGWNTGLHHGDVQTLLRRVRDLHRHSGRRVSLVGWSLGGVFALLAAREASECVRALVTLGSPISPDPSGSQATPIVRHLYRLIAHPLGPNGHLQQPDMQWYRAHERPPVPMSCLYSLSDGVVPPQEATLHGNPAMHENIRVRGSHVGMAFHGPVLGIVADRLAQAEGAWRPYRQRHNSIGMPA
jgi:pimeloyl-ACP methyl ester carboxylesterase